MPNGVECLGQTLDQLCGDIYVQILGDNDLGILCTRFLVIHPDLLNHWLPECLLHVKVAGGCLHFSQGSFLTELHIFREVEHLDQALYHWLELVSFRIINEDCVDAVGFQGESFDFEFFQVKLSSYANNLSKI